MWLVTFNRSEIFFSLWLNGCVYIFYEKYNVCIFYERVEFCCWEDVVRKKNT